MWLENIAMIHDPRCGCPRFVRKSSSRNRDPLLAARFSYLQAVYKAQLVLYD